MKENRTSNNPAGNSKPAGQTKAESSAPELPGDQLTLDTLHPPEPAKRRSAQIRVSFVAEPELTISALDTPSLAAKYWFEQCPECDWYDSSREHVVVLLLNTKLRCFGLFHVSTGTLNESLAHPRDVFRAAIVGGAYGVLLMHNHPSGDTAPSEADRRLTMRILEAARTLQMQFFDHIIVGRSIDDRCFSFREAGVL